jgi:hypothetical protein
VLDELDDFIAACAGNRTAFAHFVQGDAPTGSFEAGDIYCPGCGGPRRLRLTPLSPLRTPAVRPNPLELGPPGLDVSDADTSAIAVQLAPAIVHGVCLQDDTGFTFVLFKGPEAFELVVLPDKRGGLATPYTPASVAYYLDQAQRAQSAGAVSAAIAMYRSGLESVLHEQGFTARMLGPKINELEKAINAQTAPRWART